MKVQRDYTLTGVTITGEPARIGMEVDRFIGQSIDGKHSFGVTYTNVAQTSVELVTNKGTYVLKKHPSLNLFKGECNGHKVHVTLKKITGTLIFWA